MSGVYAQVDKDAKKKKQKKEVKEETFFDYAFVTLNTSETFKVRNLKINTDSIQYITLITKQSEIVAINDVLSLKVRTKKRQVVKHVIYFGALCASSALGVVLFSPGMDAVDGAIIVSGCLILGAGIGAGLGLKYKWEIYPLNEDYGYFQSINVGPYLSQNSIGLIVRFNMN